MPRCAPSRCERWSVKSCRTSTRLPTGMSTPTLPRSCTASRTMPLPYRTAQVASDGSHKLPQRIHPHTEGGLGGRRDRPVLGAHALRLAADAEGKGGRTAPRSPTTTPVRNRFGNCFERTTILRPWSRPWPGRRPLWPAFPEAALLRMGRTFAKLTQVGIDAALGACTVGSRESEDPISPSPWAGD